MIMFANLLLKLLFLYSFYIVCIDGFLLSDRRSHHHINAHHETCYYLHRHIIPCSITSLHSNHHYGTTTALYYMPTQDFGRKDSYLSLSDQGIEFSSSIRFLLKAALVGTTTGFTVHLFKYLISIELTLFYENLAAILPKPVLYWPFIICE